MIHFVLQSLDSEVKMPWYLPSWLPRSMYFCIIIQYLKWAGTGGGSNILRYDILIVTFLFFEPLSGKCFLSELGVYEGQWWEEIYWLPVVAWPDDGLLDFAKQRGEGGGLNSKIHHILDLYEE